MIGSLSQKKSSSVGRSIANVGWIFFDRIFRVMASLLVGVWVARYLGPGQYGQWSYALAMPAMLSSVAGLGLTNILIIKLTQKSEYTEQELLGTSFALKLLSGTVSYLAILGASYWLHSKEMLMHYLIILTSVTLVTQSFEVIDLFFQTKTKAKWSVLAKTIGFLIGTLFKIYLLVERASLFWFVSTMTVETLIAVILVALFYRKETGLFVWNWSFNSKLAKSLLITAWPLMISDFFIYVYMRLDQVMLNNMVGSAELGRYSAALKLSESWYFIAGAIVSSFYPAISKLYSDHEDLFWERYQKMINFLTALSCIVAIAISLLSPIIIEILYGDKYDGVASILSLHVWTGVPIFISISCSNLFILKGLQKFVFWKTASGAVINVLLNLVLIPHFGAIGASIATLVSQIVACYLFNAVFQDTRPVFIMQSKALKDFALLRLSNVTSLLKQA